ncbi:MAG: GNAT family N-acetyltransferase [Clostridia bacterium]|nr:GNAT family N-acetyltransferase [Clostridia bacterium]
MQLLYGAIEDIDRWMDLVKQVRWNFPGLETETAFKEHRETVLKFMGKRQAICVKDGSRIAGVMLFSRGKNMICCLAVLPTYRRRGVASMLMDEALKNLDRSKEISVSTFRADDEKGAAPRALYEKYGFIEDRLIAEMNYPNQKYILHPEGSLRKDRQLAINSMVQRIVNKLSGLRPSVYLYGSSVLDDFRLGWSDIDILVLTDGHISEEQAEALVRLRQEMLIEEPGNPYYRLFEGGILPLDNFLTKTPGRTVYWGTSGERITNTYVFDSFSAAQLIDQGALLYGKDIRDKLSRPDFHELYAAALRHYETIRKYARGAEISLYSFGWLMDTARCIYTLRTGGIISKTDAAEWALKNNLCPDADIMKTALAVRKNPLKYKSSLQALINADMLFKAVQRFADILERELKTNLKQNLSYP